MKYLDIQSLDQIPGKQLKTGDKFHFRCHPGLSCFNRCCRNLNLFLYPYDVIRLKNRLAMTSDRFLDTHVDVVLRPGHYFPDVLLKMAENDVRSCPFVDKSGCTLYSDRPDTCRSFPMEKGLQFSGAGKDPEPVFFFRPPDFCLGVQEPDTCSPETWIGDPDTARYHQMTRQWAAVDQLFGADPWGAEGPAGPRAKMAFMATYNIDRFRDFVFQSSFSRRYKIPSALFKQVKTDDTQLLKLGFDWVKCFVWNIPSKKIRPR
jgi:Fe-S-cluster containining protein